ncbi:hypothetical protein GW17_00020976 [Ensete ventricosum]|nr:hypothetical protein GW17_00020976 [Ensete ventricosum]
MRQIVANLEKLKLPTKHCGVTGETCRQGSDDVARRPPSVKAALSVSFGQRAPHRASTRDSSPVRRTLAPLHERSDGDDHWRSSPSIRRSSSRERPDRDRDCDRDRSECDRVRDRERRHEHDRCGDRDRESHRSRNSDRGCKRRDHERSRRESDEYRRSSSRRSRSRSMHIHGADSDNCPPSPFRDENREKAKIASSNLATLKDLYGDGSDKKSDEAADRLRKDTSTEEVIRLGGSTWK